MFIEGVTKDKSSTIRSECAFGLGQIGASTFRTLLLALHDPVPQVREAVRNVIEFHMHKTLLYTARTLDGNCIGDQMQYYVPVWPIDWRY